MVFKTKDTGSSPVPFEKSFKILIMHVTNINDLNFSSISRIINLIIPAKNAQLGPPVGPALSQARIKAKDFCTIFNENSSNFPNKLPLNVMIIVFTNQTFQFFIKTHNINFILKNVLKKNNGTLSIIDIYKITKIKHLDINYLSEKIIFKNILNYIKLNNIKINI